jgi:predicted transcriptional regulator
MADKKRAMTVRLPLDLYRAGARIARSRRISMSRLVQESLREALAQEERRRLFDAFGSLTESEGTEVEFARAAQAEVAGDAES